jgi:hypothetical protein
VCVMPPTEVSSLEDNFGTYSGLRKVSCAILIFTLLYFYLWWDKGIISFKLRFLIQPINSSPPPFFFICPLFYMWTCWLEGLWYWYVNSIKCFIFCFQKLIHNWSWYFSPVVGCSLCLDFRNQRLKCKRLGQISLDHIQGTVSFISLTYTSAFACRFTVL